MWARCEICGRYDFCDVHHIFAGTRRKIADRLGLTITLCQSCHDKVHAFPSKYAHLKTEAQRKYMIQTGISVEEWIELFGKSYLGDDECQ